MKGEQTIMIDSERATTRHGEPRERGSTLTEYLVVTAGLLIVYTGVDIAIGLIRRHYDNYANVLELLL